MIRPRCLISLASEGNARGYSEAALSDGPYRLVLVCVPLLSPYVWALPWLAALGAWHLPRCKVVCGGVFEGRRSAGIPRADVWYRSRYSLWQIGHSNNQCEVSEDAH